MTERTVNIGGASGMWGDSCLSTPQLLGDGRCHYLIYEGLAEVTMAILTKARMRDASHGYAHDLITTIATNLAQIRDAGVKVITNAGGINPQAAAHKLRAIAAASGVEVKIAAVSGDNLIPQTERLVELGIREMTRGTPVPTRPVSMNAYLGARPIAAALDAGADIVVTGRCVDSALALGPLIHEYRWAPTDFDELSGGSLAGHLIECGPQSTGGLLTDWADTSSWANSGFPIAMVRADGTFDITTPQNTDALVDRRTVIEQLLYEIGDPRAYFLPDVTCDWSQVEVKEVGPDRVEVSGARGAAPTPTLKACAQVPDGYRAQVQFFLGGRDADKRGRRAANDLLARANTIFAARGFSDFRDTLIEIIGAEDTYGANKRTAGAREVMVRIALHHDQPDALVAFIREFPSIGLGGPCGVGGMGAGLPKPSPVLRLESFLVPRELVAVDIDVDGQSLASSEWCDVSVDMCQVPERRIEAVAEPDPATSDVVELPLLAIAFGRSGDKGDNVNIGVAARSSEFEAIIQAQVTAERVGEYLAHFGASHIERFRLPGCQAINLLLHQALGGGGAASLRIDPQGKAAAQQLLEMPIRLPVVLLQHPALARIPEVDAARRERTNNEVHC